MRSASGTGCSSDKDLPVQHAHVFGPVGLDHVAGQDTRAVLMQVIGDDAGNFAPEVVRGPAGEVAVTDGAGVTDFVAELGVSVSDHIA